jgi:hypothetical protein
MAAKKKVRKKTATRRGRGAEALDRLEAELPPNLKELSRRVRRDLTRLERQIETARSDARRRWARVLRDASHELGRLEAIGEKRFRKLTTQARRDAVKVLRRLEKAIEPPKKKRVARKTRKKKAPAKTASGTET